MFLVDPGSLTGYEVPSLPERHSYQHPGPDRFPVTLPSTHCVFQLVVCHYRRADIDVHHAIVALPVPQRFLLHAASAFIVTLCFCGGGAPDDKPMQTRAALVMGGLPVSQCSCVGSTPSTSSCPACPSYGGGGGNPEQKTSGIAPGSGLLAALLPAACYSSFSIQLVLWKVYFNSWLTIPQGDFYVDYRPLAAAHPLSPFRGLLPWMPVALPALIGLLLLARKNPYLVVPLFVVLLLALYVNASTRDWFGGGGYGPRRFTSELPIWALGYTALLAALAPRLRVWVGGLLAALLIVHQWILLAFGIPEELGGRVTSMAPTYTWRRRHGRNSPILARTYPRPADNHRARRILYGNGSTTYPRCAPNYLFG